MTEYERTLAYTPLHPIMDAPTPKEVMSKKEMKRIRQRMNKLASQGAIQQGTADSFKNAMGLIRQLEKSKK